MEIMNLAEIMDRSIAILKKYLSTIVVFKLLYGLIYIGVAFALIMVFAIFSVIVAMTTKSMVAMMIILFIIIVSILTLTFTGNIGIIKIASQEFSNERVDMATALGYAMKSIPKVLGITAIEVGLLIPIAIIFNLLFKIGAKSYTELFLTFKISINHPVILVVLVIAFMLLVVGLIWAYYTLFSFSIFAVAVERKGVLDSIKRSLELIKHSFWKVFGCGILFFFTVTFVRYSIQGCIGLFFSIIYLLLKALNVNMDFTIFITMTLNVTQFPIAILFALIISPLSTIMTTMLYYNQRFKKEGLDIILRLRDIERSEERKQLSGLYRFNYPN